ncbi:sensor histidine kinase [Kribbella sp. NPDC056345]|uniref:sensor histidine kinase n=1 Tax=Kribbella sp. NPDC056345 TaxID=3345789 RepID=UPI0035E2FB4D
MSRAAAWWRRVPAPVVDLLLVAIAAGDIWVNLWDDTRLAVVLAVPGCVALVFRRRFPLAVFLLTVPISLTQDVAVAPLIALFTLAERSQNRRLLAGCVTVAAAASSVPWILESVTAAERTMTLVDFAYNLATAATPVLLGQLVQARRDLARRLDEIEEVREHEHALHAQAVLARERAQLAREMHDVVSHQVSLIAVQAGALQVASKDADAKEAARTIRTLSVNTLDELRTMVTLLRASGGRDTELAPQPTLADLHRLVTSSGTGAELTGQLPSTVSPPAQRAIYRTVQEALTNVRKHAPGATASVELWQNGTDIGVTVTNTPSTRPSLPLPGSQQGLLGLRERADLLNGSLKAGPTAAGGYEVRLQIPLTAD